MSLSFRFLFFFCASKVIEINSHEAQLVQTFSSEADDKEVRCHANKGGHLGITSSTEATNLPHKCCQATMVVMTVSLQTQTNFEPMTLADTVPPTAIL